ncbi:hypothetical protein CBOM_07492 [Ceraceosorus bombacis]|uniref:Uncharacterized protein n=1 Tax=Ceraceosorus bombacis TaxID=401625 RepID=A0A0P1B8C3_9BASI|nr:hypothetical protein CBOM_07492 [Ceraceosorus bombacis]
MILPTLITCTFNLTREQSPGRRSTRTTSGGAAASDRTAAVRTLASIAKSMQLEVSQRGSSCFC